MDRLNFNKIKSLFRDRWRNRSFSRLSLTLKSIQSNKILNEKDSTPMHSSLVHVNKVSKSQRIIPKILKLKCVKTIFTKAFVNSHIYAVLLMVSMSYEIKNNLVKDIRQSYVKIIILKVFVLMATGVNTLTILYIIRTLL